MKQKGVSLIVSHRAENKKAIFSSRQHAPKNTLILCCLTGKVLLVYESSWLFTREPASFAQRKLDSHRKSNKIKDKNSVNMAAYLYNLSALCLIYKSESKNKANRCIKVT